MIRLTTMCVVAAASTAASAQTLDFAGLVHGEIVNTQYSGLGIDISAINPNRGFNLAVAFDTTQTGTSDPDLEDPFVIGNISGSTFLGNVLIIQENDTGIGDGVADDPDDEGSRPAGQLIFDLGFTAFDFGFDIIDIEGSLSESSSLEFRLGGGVVETISFADFEDGGAFDQDAVFGNNTLNRISGLVIAGGYDELIINVGGSSAYDNLVFPTPSSLALLGLGGLVASRRRR